MKYLHVQMEYTENIRSYTIENTRLLDYCLLLNICNLFYPCDISSTSFYDVMCLVGHTFISGTHSIMVCG